MKHLYTLVILFIFAGSSLLKAQEPLTDRIVIEFMKPGDPDAQARNYNLVDWPDEARAAAYKAAEIWASYLEITVPVRVKFGWCDNILYEAQGGSTYSSKFTDDFYYPYSLLDQLLCYDKNPNTSDIICVFNSEVNWYLGLEEKQQWYTDINDPSIQYSKNSIIPTMLHEICHGLGISTSFKVENGKGDWGGSVSQPRIYDSFLIDKNGNNLINQEVYTKNSEDLCLALTSNNIFWSGHKAKINNNGEQVQLHAPKEWYSASINHIDFKFSRTINDLMSFGTGSVTSNNGMDNYYTMSPGPIVLGMLQDIGWTLKSSITATEKTQIESPVKIYTSGRNIIIEGADHNENILVCDFSGRVIFTGKGSGAISMDQGLYIVRVAGKSFKVKL